MPNDNNRRNCWIAGAVLGVLVWIFTAGIGPLHWFEGLVLGVIAGLLSGRLFIWLICEGTDTSFEYESDPAQTASGPSVTEVMAAGAKARPEDLTAAVPVEPASQSKTDVEGSAPTGEAATDEAGSGRRLSGRNDIYKAGSSDPAPAKPDVATKGNDDLKKIKGVGPKLEVLLRENGITSFGQISAWSDSDIDHFAEVIGWMGGKIRSDDWVAQARILAEGGETEFSQRVDEGDVY